MSDPIDDILEELDYPFDDLDRTRSSLQLAALLGPVVREDEWRATCRARGGEPCEALADALVEAGLAERDPDAWRFVDPDWHEELVARLRAQPTWRGLNATCAQALLGFPMEQRSGLAERCAVHLLEANDREGALDPLLEAARETYGRGRYDEAHGHLDTHQRLLDDLAASPDDPRRAQHHWRRAQMLHIQGERADALALVERSRRLLESTGWASERAHAARLHGVMLREEGRLEEARRCFEDAVADYALAGNNHGLAASRAGHAYVELERGEPGRARELFQAALRVFDELGDSFKVASMWDQIAYTWLCEGELDEAERCSKRAEEMARDAGHSPIEGAAWNTLGEIARAGGDWERAREYYERAVQMWEATDDRNLHIARYNLALVELEAGAYDEARALLEDAEERFGELGLAPYLALVAAGLMTCYAAAADWEAFEHEYARAADGVDRLGVGAEDFAWMVRRAGALAEQHGRSELARRAAELGERAQPG